MHGPHAQHATCTAHDEHSCVLTYAGTKSNAVYGAASRPSNVATFQTCSHAVHEGSGDVHCMCIPLEGRHRGKYAPQEQLDVAACRDTSARRGEKRGLVMQHGSVANSRHGVATPLNSDEIQGLGGKKEETRERVGSVQCMPYCYGTLHADR